MAAMHYLLFYEMASEANERQDEWADAHWRHCQASVRSGELLLGGPLVEPEDGRAILLFKADRPDVVEAFAKNDPYVITGVVKRWRVRKWWTVVGHAAASPTPTPLP